MPIDPRIPLMGRPIQVPTVLESYGRALSLRDMLDAQKMRQMQIEGQELNLAQAQEAKQEQDFWKRTYQANARWDASAGKMVLDTAGMIKAGRDAGYTARAMEIQQGAQQLEEEATKREIERITSDAALLQQLRPQFQTTDEGALLTEYQRLNPRVKQYFGLPTQATPEAVGHLKGLIDRTITEAEKLRERKEVAETKTAELTLAEKEKTPEVRADEALALLTKVKPALKGLSAEEQRAVFKQAGLEIEKPVEPPKPDYSEKVFEDAYAETIGKTPQELSSADKADAIVWAKKRIPQQETEFDKRLALLKRDPETYDRLYGRGARKPTPEKIADIIHDIFGRSVRENLDEEETEASYEQERKMLADYIELPPYSRREKIIEINGVKWRKVPGGYQEVIEK